MVKGGTISGVKKKKGAYLVVEAHFQITRFQNGRWTEPTGELNHLTGKRKFFFKKTTKIWSKSVRNGGNCMFLSDDG